MSTRGQFNTKNPTIKRILKEASELAANASPDLHAEPLEDNLFEWHFTLRGPPSPSPYEGGIYHGRIILPPTYPLRPPSFRFLTATGRFEVNREICLSISGHHEETWQPAWGIRTAMVAIRSFMDTDAKGQLGGIECSAPARKKMAIESGAFTCPACGKSNADIIREREEAARLIEAKEGKQKEEDVPEELRLAYRDELGKDTTEQEKAVKEPKGKERAGAPPSTSPPVTHVRSASIPAPRPTRTVQPVIRQVAQQTPDRSMAWIDAGIYGIVATLLFMVFRKLF
ncbi:UBC-like protein [Melanomma pulvis-pyrius CBS 109.77]|uniref:UBC-like protein n=1 Tax=Melanomma pulvis-pyrius CBS 109.77 TaxID=1314802 RepID=A0A6A6XJI3_9PLEO|nr:UBC-like protein [Melanomma pulvis-pyrius CBS 109.77]